jgi:hypothetical protein
MYSISYCKDNIKCDSASNAPKCPLNNGVPIVQKLVVEAAFEGKFFLHSISYCNDIIKFDSVSNAPKCPLNNGVSIVQKLVKLSNTSTKLDNVFATAGYNIVEVFESLTASF